MRSMHGRHGRCTRECNMAGRLRTPLPPHLHSKLDAGRTRALSLPTLRGRPTRSAQAHGLPARALRCMQQRLPSRRRVTRRWPGQMRLLHWPRRVTDVARELGLLRQKLLRVRQLMLALGRLPCLRRCMHRRWPQRLWRRKLALGRLPGLRKECGSGGLPSASSCPETTGGASRRRQRRVPYCLRRGSVRL